MNELSSNYETYQNNPTEQDLLDTQELLRQKIIGLGEKSIRKSYYPELQKRIKEIEKVNTLLEQKNTELENYLYIASHDLRSPLVNIHGFSSLFDKQCTQIIQDLQNMNLEGENAQKREAILNILQTKTMQSINFIVSNTIKMDSLLNGLLKVSRTGRIVMTLKQIDMNQLISLILKQHSFELEQINSKLEVLDLPPCYGDFDLLSQVFSNFISNAIKYHEPTRDLCIKIFGSSKNNYSTYDITDNGIGISERHINKIWDIFFRANKTNDTSGEGLGLSIIKRIADKHQGSVSVKSKEGEGSTFTITIPNQPLKEQI